MPNSIRQCYKRKCLDCIETSSKTGSCSYEVRCLGRQDRGNLAVSLGVACRYGLTEQSLPSDKSESKRELLEMPDGPWNWKEEDKTTLLDGGEPLPNPHHPSFLRDGAQSLP